MARLLSEDFDLLCQYINNYKLDGLVVDEDALPVLSACHKKYYSYLVIIEEFRIIVDDTNYTPIVTVQQFEFLQESCSDIGQAFFLTMNGCYKGARLLLRSSIENFLKGICFDEDKNIIINKSVYKVFNRAKATSAFAGNKLPLHEALHDIYGNLCQDVHTANGQHMASVTALNHFPAFNKNEASSIQRIIQRLSNLYITALALKFNKSYHHIGFENKDILNKEILNDFKQIVHNL